MSEEWGSLMTTDICGTDLNADQISVEEKSLFKWFSCSGEVSDQEIRFHLLSYAKCKDENAFISGCIIESQDKDMCEIVNLFGKTWDKGSVFYKHLSTLFKMSSQHIMQLEEGASVNITALGTNTLWKSKTNKNYKKARFYCVELCFCLREFIHRLLCSPDYYWLLKKLYPSISKNLKNLRRHLGRLVDLPDYVFLHGSNSSGNNCMTASYHLMHLHLDLRWLHLTLLVSLSRARLQIGGFEEDFSDNTLILELQNLILELMELAVKRFEKLDSSHLIFKSPFSCTCVQELWLLIMKLCNSLNNDGSGKNFWDYVSQYLDVGTFHKLEEQTEDSNQVYKLYRGSGAAPLFSFWLLYHVARLYKQENKDNESHYPLLESILKTCLNRDTSEAHLRTILFFIEVICLKIWEPKAEIVVLLWEYFNKKLNNTFYIPGAPPDTVAIVSKSALGLLSQVKSYLIDRSNVTDSFQHFLRIIGLHLKQTQSLPRHWNLLKGRIYSKLAPSKITSLSHIGEYHFVSLFLTLAISADMKQVETKMIELVNACLEVKHYLSERILKGELALVLLLIENGQNASSALQPVSNFISTLNCLEHPDLMRIYVVAFQDVLSMKQPLSLGQHLFIDGWISDYLYSSSQTDTSRLLDTLITLLERLTCYCDFHSPEQEVVLTIEKLWCELSAYLDGVTSASSAPHQISDLAHHLATVSLRVGNKQRFIHIINMFLNKTFTDLSIVRRFICNLVRREGIETVLPNYGKILIKTWMRCCVLCSDMDHTEMKELTGVISKLPEITDLCGDLVTDLMDSKEPFMEFMSCLHAKYSSEDIFKKQSLREKVSSYLDSVEGWTKPLISPPRDLQVVKRLYLTIGNLILLNGPLLYVKSKPNTLLQQLVDLLLLPNTVRNPETKLHSFILSAVKGSLHLYLQGLIALGPDQDPYISRTLKELVLIYLPRCVQSPQQQAMRLHSSDCFILVTQFDLLPPHCRTLIIQTLSDVFIKRKSRNQHPQALDALKFLKEVISVHRSTETVLESVVRGCVERLCDVVMYCEDRSPVVAMAREILKALFTSQTLRDDNQLLESLMTGLQAVCREHLAWSSRQLFDLFTSQLCSQAPDLVKRFLPTLLEQIKQVELKRGVGYDRTLRLGLERIENTLRGGFKLK